MNFTTPRSFPRAPTSRSQRLRTAKAQSLEQAGGRRGRVTGTFFHAIAAAQR